MVQGHIDSDCTLSATVNKLHAQPEGEWVVHTCFRLGHPSHHQNRPSTGLAGSAPAQSI